MRSKTCFRFKNKTRQQNPKCSRNYMNFRNKQQKWGKKDKMVISLYILCGQGKFIAEMQRILYEL